MRRSGSYTASRDAGSSRLRGAGHRKRELTFTTGTDPPLTCLAVFALEALAALARENDRHRSTPLVSHRAGYRYCANAPISHFVRVVPRWKSLLARWLIAGVCLLWRSSCHGRWLSDRGGGCFQECWRANSPKNWGLGILALCVLGEPITRYSEAILHGLAQPSRYALPKFEHRNARSRGLNVLCCYSHHFRVSLSQWVFRETLLNLLRLV